VDNLFPSLVSASLKATYEKENVPSLFTSYPWATLVIVGLVAVGALASTIGMFFFQRWARFLSLVIVFATLILAPLTGAQLLSGASYSFYFLSTTIWGAVLAIAYFTPLSQRFVKECR